MLDKIGLNHEVLPFSDYKKGRAPVVPCLYPSSILLEAYFKIDIRRVIWDVPAVSV